MAFYESLLVPSLSFNNTSSVEIELTEVEWQERQPNDKL